MAMQTDVKSATVVGGQTDANVFNGPARIKGILVSYPSAGTFVLKDGGSTVFSFTAPAAIGTVNVLIPGEASCAAPVSRQRPQLVPSSRCSMAKKNPTLAVGRGEKLPVSQGAGLTAKGRAKYNKATGSNLKAPAPNPKTEKDAARRKSFCARMSGMPGPMKDEKGRPTRKAASLKRWNCK